MNDPGFNFKQGQEIFSSLKHPDNVWPTKSLFNGKWVFFSCVLSSWNVKLTIHLNLLLKSWIGVATHLLPLYVLMAWTGPSTFLPFT